MRISDWSSDVCSSDLLPANIDITNFSVQAGEQSLAVFSRHDLEKKAKNRAMWTQIGIAALGGLAAAGAASQRDTYRSSFYTPRGSFHGYYCQPRAPRPIQHHALPPRTGYPLHQLPHPHHHPAGPCFGKERGN